MDGATFDALVKRLTQTRLSRVAALRGVLASVVVGLTGASLAADTAAKRKRKRASKKRGKGQKRRHDRHQTLQRQGLTKVTLCHQGQTIAVPPSAVQTHLNHGDTVGACGAPTPGPCTPNGSACSQGSQCCTGNCFNLACAELASECEGTPCPPGATGCCPGDGCCQLPANQCNITGGQPGLCCAPNCADRECGPDGCGNGGTCGSCALGQKCGPNGKCQGPSTCSSGTCPNGCCAPNGTCQPGTTEQACGTNGHACVNCSGSKSTCQSGQCVCVPQCQGKQCGPDGCGGLCGSCPSGQTCNAQSGQCKPPGCSPTTCPNGCCDSTGLCRTDQRSCQGNGGPCCAGCCGDDGSGTVTCQSGASLGACGANGSACIECDPFQGHCAQGRCQCDAAFCAQVGFPNGCCENGPGKPGECFSGTIPQGCGADGAQCVVCPSGTVCNSQRQCACTPTTCPSGQQCCGDGSCKTRLGGQCSGDTDCCVGQTCCLGTCRLPAGASGCTTNEQCCSRTDDGSPVCCGGTCCFSCEGCNPADNQCVGDPIPGCACFPGSCPGGQACCGDICCINGRQCCDGQCKVDIGACSANTDCCTGLCCGGRCCIRGTQCCGGICSQQC